MSEGNYGSGVQVRSRQASSHTFRLILGSRRNLRGAEIPARERDEIGESASYIDSKTYISHPLPPVVCAGNTPSPIPDLFLATLSQLGHG
jgi:hypothetical protein